MTAEQYLKQARERLNSATDDSLEAFLEQGAIDGALDELLNRPSVIIIEFSKHPDAARQFAEALLARLDGDGDGDGSR